VQCEVEGIEPNILRDIILDGVAEWMDEESGALAVYEDILEAEAEEQALIERFLSTWPECLREQS
jgi:hypothetical protein